MRKGRSWKAAPSNVLSATGCPECGKVTAANKRRLTGAIIRERIAGRDIVMVGNYTTANTKTLFECKEGHSWTAKPNHVMRGSGCPRCNGRKGTVIIDRREFNSIGSAAQAFGVPRPGLFSNLKRMVTRTSTRDLAAAKSSFHTGTESRCHAADESPCYTPADSSRRTEKNTHKVVHLSLHHISGSKAFPP